MCLSSWARGDIKQLLCIYFLHAVMIPSRSESPPKASQQLSTDHGLLSWPHNLYMVRGKTKSIFLLWLLMDVAVTQVPQHTAVVSTNKQQEIMPRPLWASGDTAQRCCSRKTTCWCQLRGAAQEHGIGQGFPASGRSQNTGLTTQLQLPASRSSFQHAWRGLGDTAPPGFPWPSWGCCMPWRALQGRSMRPTLSTPNCPGAPWPGTLPHKGNKCSSPCSRTHLTPGTAGNSCGEELSGKRKAEKRAARTHNIRWGGTAFWGKPTVPIPSGAPWPCWGWAITSKAGSDPASISGNLPTIIRSSGLNPWRLWTSQVHSHSGRFWTLAKTSNLSSWGSVDQLMPGHNSQAGKPKE